MSCVIHEVVSYLNSDELLTYLSVFRKDSAIYKSICEGFHGVFRWPLLKAGCEPTVAGEHNIVVRKRAMPGKLSHFPHMQELLLDAMIDTHDLKVAGRFIHDALRELRATLLCGHLRSLKRLRVRNVILDTANAGALKIDLPAMLRDGSLKSLEFVELDVQEEIGDDEFVPVIKRASLAREVIEALAKMPRLQDFVVQFNPLTDFSSMFMRQRWPSLTILRSNFLLCCYAQGDVREVANDSLAYFWARGHFPSVSTLVVGEWISGAFPLACDLFNDLPTDGMPQITKLVLTGRVLKNPLLNFRVPGLLTQEEQHNGGGGVIAAPLFRNVQTLDVSRLFVPVAISRHLVEEQGLFDYDDYAASFIANTCRAVRNVSASLVQTVASLPTLILSDALFGGEDWTQDVSGAISDCIEALRPAKLVVDKLELEQEGNAHCGQRVFTDCRPGSTLVANVLACGLRRYENPCANHLGEEYLMERENLFRLLTETPGLQACVVELELDSAFLFSFAGVLELVFLTAKPDDWLDDCLEFLDSGDEDDVEDEELVRDLFEGTCSRWQFHKRVIRMSAAHRERIASLVTSGDCTFCDLAAALHPFQNLRKIVVNNEQLLQWRHHSPDLESLCELPPPGCQSLEVRSAYRAGHLGEFRKHVWAPLLEGRSERKMFEVFAPLRRTTNWVQGSFELTAASHGGSSRLSAEMRSFSKHHRQLVDESPTASGGPTM